MEKELAYRYFGGEGNRPLIILHGFLGSSRNWQSIGKALSEDFEVFALDARNHGDSPHDDDTSYAAMAEDVLAFMDNRDLDGVVLVGHSMGGKTAMKVATENPDRIDALVVVDIAPRAYPPKYETEFQAMNDLDLDSLKLRDDAESFFAERVEDWAMRKFLLTNLVRQPDAGYRWQINLKALTKGRAEVFADSLNENERYDGPTLFIRGGESPYIEDQDSPTIEKYFPNFISTTISGAGHNVHVEKKDGFLNSLRFFFDRHAFPKKDQV